MELQPINLKHLVKPSGGAGSNVSGGGGGAGGSGGAGTTFAAEPGGAINQTGDPVQLSGTTYTTAAGAGGWW